MGVRGRGIHDGGKLGQSASEALANDLRAECQGDASGQVGVESPKGILGFAEAGQGVAQAAGGHVGPQVVQRGQDRAAQDRRGDSSRRGLGPTITPTRKSRIGQRP